MDNDQLKDKFEQEIFGKVIDEVEVRILKKREQLLKLGMEFISTVAKENTTGSVKFRDETQDKMEDIKKQYNELIQDISKEVKLHNYIKRKHEVISDFLNGWLRSEHYEIANVNRYIEESFARKALDTEQ